MDIRVKRISESDVSNWFLYKFQFGGELFGGKFKSNEDFFEDAKKKFPGHEFLIVQL